MRFRVVFNQTQQRLPIKFRSVERGFAVQFENLQTATVREDVEYYDGSYAVTPDVQAQTILTAAKLMKDNLTVNAIPFFNVSNPAGGNTIYIGNEV